VMFCYEQLQVTLSNTYPVGDMYQFPAGKSPNVCASGFLLPVAVAVWLASVKL
jgi:hypothetical protein